MCFQCIIARRDSQQVSALFHILQAEDRRQNASGSGGPVKTAPAYRAILRRADETAVCAKFAGGEAFGKGAARSAVRQIFQKTPDSERGGFPAAQDEADTAAGGNA